MMKKHLLIPLYLLSTGCVHNYSIDGNTKFIKEWSFGITKIEYNADSKSIESKDITTLGLWASQTGSGLGYKRDERVIVSEDCKVVFMIQNENQLEESIKLIKQQLSKSKEEICIVSK